MGIEMDMAYLEPLIREAIRDGGQFILTPKGVSMLPTIVPIKDKIVLTEPDDIKKNDIILYKRNSGIYVAHRIMKVNEGHYTMCGDNQFVFEKGIAKGQIIAVVSQVRKCDGSVLSRKDIQSRRRLAVLAAKRVFKRSLHLAKCLLYPIYRCFFKRNETLDK